MLIFEINEFSVGFYYLIDKKIQPPQARHFSVCVSIFFLIIIIVTSGSTQSSLRRVLIVFVIADYSSLRD